LLDKLAVQSEPVDSRADLSPFDILLIGKAALTPDGSAPDITRVRDGLKVILFEQTSQVLERRFGFRIAAYGLRTLFPRVPDHPALAGLSAAHLHDWRGAATLLPEKLTYELRPRYGPTVPWCGIPVPRLWRCGNRGNVASVLIEKPARGDFLSLLDGAYALQYSALLEQHEGHGMILFCQADVTGRTESDPAAEMLVRNLLVHAATWKPGPQRKAVYAGESAGKNYLESAGIPVRRYEGGKLSDDEVFVAGPGVWKTVERSAANIGEWLAAGGNMLALGLDQKDVDALLPGKVEMKEREHINAFFQSSGVGKLLTGVAPGDVHNRDPRQLPLVARGAEIYGDGILAQSDKPNILFCQLAPWQFEGTGQMNLKRTQRHVAVLLSRLLANLGVTSATPTVERFHRPVVAGEGEKRWLVGFYLDQPEEWDDPYRFFRW
jgi:hypothetical protein